MYTVENYKKHLQPADKLMTKTTGINFYYLGNSIANEKQVEEYFTKHKKECCAELRHLNSITKTILQNYCLILFGKRQLFYSRFPEDGNPYPHIILSKWFARYILKYRPNIHVLIEKVQEWLKEGKVLVKEVDGYFFKEEPNIKPFKDLNEWLFIHSLYMDECGTIFELSNCHDNTTTNPQNILAFANPLSDGYVAPKGHIKFLCTVNTRYGCMDALKSLRGQGHSYMPYVQKVQHYKEEQTATYSYHPDKKKIVQRGCTTIHTTEPDLSKTMTQVWEIVQ